jgi:hypothetical protein
MVGLLRLLLLRESSTGDVERSRRAVAILFSVRVKLVESHTACCCHTRRGFGRTSGTGCQSAVEISAPQGCWVAAGAGPAECTTKAGSPAVRVASKGYQAALLLLLNSKPGLTATQLLFIDRQS